MLALSYLRLFLFTSVLYVTNQTYAQNFMWARSFGGAEYNSSKSITTDNSGNVFVLGWFMGTVDFDPGPAEFNLTSEGNRDVYIQKMDSLGNFLWARAFGGTGSDEGRSITIDSEGNVYSVGSFWATVDFDPGVGVHSITTAGGDDIFIHKMDSEGNFVWVKTLGSVSSDDAEAIISDEYEYMYITGNFQYTVDFDPGAGVSNLTSISPGVDIFVLKLDLDGNYIWAKSFEGSYPVDVGHSIAIDAESNVYTTGNFGGTVDFDPGIGVHNLTSLTERDIFIHKLDTYGNFIWVKSIGADVYDIYGPSISVDGLGNVYTSAEFLSTADFNPGPDVHYMTSEGETDFFVQKLDTDGNFLWAKSFGGDNSDHCYSIDTDIAGNSYVTGFFSGIVDFDPSPEVYNLVSDGFSDAYILRLNPSGNFQWAKRLGGSSSTDVGFAITVDETKSIFTTGIYRETVDFDPGPEVSNLTAVANYDVYVHKMSACTYYNTDTIKSCDPITWIDGVTYTESNNIATHTLITQSGCDSIITLNLEIDPISVEVVNNDPILSAIEVDAEYQWLDCLNDYSMIPGATSIDFEPEENGEYAVEVSSRGCVDTSSCYAIISVGLNENESIKKIKVYPNPGKGVINVTSENEKIVEISVYSLKGDLICHSENIGSKQYTFNIHAESGIYFIEIKTLTDISRLKLLLN